MRSEAERARTSFSVYLRRYHGITVTPGQASVFLSAADVNPHAPLRRPKPRDLITFLHGKAAEVAK